MMGHILCSTGALLGRPNGRDYRLLTALVPQLQCDGYELMIYRDWYADLDGLLGFLAQAKLNIPVLHCEKGIGESLSIGGEELTAKAFSDFECNCRIACAAGADRLVLHLWGGHASDGQIQNNLNAYPALRETADRYCLDLLVENVVCNREDPMKHLCELRQLYPDVHFVFDTKMAAFHSQLELLYQPEYDWLWQEGHIRHYHVNDYGGGHMDWQNLRTLPIGEGNVDFESFFAFIRQTGYAGDFTVEATAFDQTGAVDTEMLDRQFRLIREKIGG